MAKMTFYNTTANDKNIAGYCYYHHLYMTVNQIRTRECLKKQCGALKKLEHPWWAEREKLKKQKKKNRKKGIYGRR